jgi:prolyl-tRNA synthetase
LIGIPVRFVVSEKTVAEGKVEVKFRTDNDSELLTVEQAMGKLKN